MKTHGFRVTGDTAVCLACGSPAVRDKVWRCPQCQCQRKHRPGLGDLVKTGLSAVGITEERVSRILGRPCNCGKRAEKLNELGRKYLGIGGNAVDAPAGDTPR